MPSDVQSGGGYGGTLSKRPRRPPRNVVPQAHPRRGNPFGPLGRADAPITGAQRAAHARTRHAARALPPRLVPAVPALRHPTRRQTAAATELSRRSFQAQAPRNQPARERGQQLTQIARDLHADPRTRGRQNLLDAYAQGAADDFAARLARRSGLRGGARGRAVAIGRQLIAQHIASNPRLREGRAPTVVKAGFLPDINLSAIGRTIGSVTTLDRGDLGPREFVRHSLSDVAALGEAPFVGGYEVGRGATEAVAHGDTRRLEDLARGVAQGIVHSVPGELVQGHPGAAAESFRQHPVFAALDVGGATAVAGRAAGALARGAGSTVDAAGARGALARAGSTVRPAIGLNVDGGLAHVQRSYSRDSTRKLAEIAIDSRREPLLDAHGRQVFVEDPRSHRPVPVLKAHPGEHDLLHARRMDFTASRANATERLERDVTQRELTRAQHGQRRARISRRALPIVSMAVEGTLRRAHFTEDVAKRIDRIESKLREPEQHYRHTDEVGKARDELTALRRAQQLSPEQQTRLFAAAEKIGRARRAQDVEYARLGIKPREELDRAALGPYAMSHMDARHVTVEEHQALEAQARRSERSARAKVEGLPKGPDRARALAEWRQARNQRIAVSGRDPDLVRRSESAGLQARRAEDAHARAGGEVRKLEQRRARLVGAQSSRRGTRQAAGQAARATVAEQRKLERVDRELRQAREKERAAGKASREARSQAQSAKVPETQAALRRADGTFLSNAEIESHMRGHGVDPETIGQLTHREIGNRAFHKRFDLARPSGRSQRRTGAAFERGASGFGARQVEESGVNAATTIAKAEQVDRAISDNALRHPAAAKAERGEKLTAHEQRIVERGGGFTPKEALEVADRLEHDTGRAYVPVRMHGAAASAETRGLVADLQKPGSFDLLGGKLLNDRVVTGDVKPRDRGPRNVVLIPAEDFNRLARHLAPAGEVEKLVQMLNRPFRFSVLAQPRWLTGNFVEPYLVRLPMSGSGLVNIPGMGLDIARSVRTLRRMERSGDPAVRAVAREIRAQQTGGLFLGGRGASNRRRAAESEFRVIRAGAYVRDLPVLKQLGDLLSVVPTQYFRANRQLIEQWAQHAALGRSIRRDLQELHGSWLKAWSIGQEALQDAERGLMHTPTQERYMRAQHELLGKYEGLSPVGRRLVQTVFPFVPWAMSAARFVFWTMPAHHTIKTALLVKSSQVVEQAWEDEHQDAPPGGLQLAVRTKNGGFVDLARYTPYGLSGPAVEGDLQGITDQFLPQVSGAVAAIEGRDPFGRDLRVKPTKDNPQGIPSVGQRVLIALNTLGEATLGPFPSQVRRVREGGGTPYADSTVFSPKVKPGTSHGMSGLRRTYDPFRPVYLRKRQTAGRVVPLPADDPRRVLAGSRGHAAARPDVSEAQSILAGSR